MKKLTLLLLGSLALSVYCKAQPKRNDNTTTYIDLIIRNSPKQKFTLECDLAPNKRMIVDTALLGEKSSVDSLHFELNTVTQETKFMLLFNKKRVTSSRVLLSPGDHLRILIDFNDPSVVTFTGSARTSEFWDFLHKGQAIGGTDMSKYMTALRNGSPDSTNLKYKIDSINQRKAAFIRKNIFNTESAGIAEFALLMSQNGVINYTDEEFAFLTGRFERYSIVLGQIELNKKVQGKSVTFKPKPANNTIIKNFILPDEHGKAVDFSKLNNGKYVLLDFWASWCVPCRKEAPYLKEALKRFGKDNFIIVSVSIDENHADWRKAINQDGTTGFTHLIDDRGKNSPVKNQYNIDAIPSNFLVDPTGKIIDKDLREDKLISRLSEVLAQK